MREWTDPIQVDIPEAVHEPWIPSEENAVVLECDRVSIVCDRTREILGKRSNEGTEGAASSA